MIDAVLSEHLNPLTCGVAKWNIALARRLGVPCLGLMSHEAREAVHPLISVKPSETKTLPGWFDSYDIFLHGVPEHSGWLTRADNIYAANSVIARSVHGVCPGVVTAWCPSTVEGNASRGSYRVLTFGMAHKLVLPHFRNLKLELERDHPDYTLSLSTAVHEGSPWDEALTQSTEAMREIFGDRLRVLGFLADDALARELLECDAVAAFFVPALRANNTSAWAALSAGKFLYTNLDAQSPALDPEAYGWDALLKVLA